LQTESEEGSESPPEEPHIATKTMAMGDKSDASIENSPEQRSDSLSEENVGTNLGRQTPT
jgi:hypothetical protein